MSDLLKINRNGQIFEIALDRPEAKALDVGLEALWDQLADPCFEIIPLKGIEKKVARTQAYEIRRQ
jgi:hypothetical protein